MALDDCTWHVHGAGGRLRRQRFGAGNANTDANANTHADANTDTNTDTVYQRGLVIDSQPSRSASPRPPSISKGIGD